MKRLPNIIALYLPQFHQIPENDEFWGKGFTDWITVKNARPLFEGHKQPRIPLNNNYYDLSLKENVEWQAKLAKNYGIYGFGVYHYWFNNDKNLLTKPAEIMRDDENIETKYFFIWDNGNWKRSWSNVPGNDWAPISDNQRIKSGPQILIPYILGSEPDWKNHYSYLLSHFKSLRYEKYNNKPVFCIFDYNEALLPMCNLWNLLAKNDGFDGIHFVFKNTRTNDLPRGSFRYSYEPHSSGWWRQMSFMDRVFNKLHIFQKEQPKIAIYSYDELWKQILSNSLRHPEPYYYPGAFVSYDDSPRRGDNHAIIVEGGTPDKFKKYFSELIRITSDQKKDYIFLTAWNEWGECAYMEPDTDNRYKYLEAICNSI